ncbi:hypothetical protein CVS40_8209 [Lucilia cuprina]|nr:hypothetical protein CVS40_8209 [Lucilia cuprina]
MSYAETIKNAVIPDQNKQVPLIVKPKERQDAEKTKEELNKKVDPVNLKITKIENRKNGTVIIQSENNEEREKIKNAIQIKLNENYDIKVPSPRNLILKITDISFDYTEDEIIEKIKKQNPIINGELKLIQKYEYKINDKRKIYTIKVIVDNDTYYKLISEQKINIGWERCRVFDGTDIIQCMKCRGYNHKARECKNQECCLKCHGCHKTKECDKEQINKCINCIRMNNRLNMGLDDNHQTNNKECPVYQNKLKIKKKNLGLYE